MKKMLLIETFLPKNLAVSPISMNISALVIDSPDPVDRVYAQQINVVHIDRILLAQRVLPMIAKALERNP